MTDMMKKLQGIGIVPVVVLENADDAVPLAERLMYFVRLVVNSGNWVHNRSAYLGAE